MNKKQILRNMASNYGRMGTQIIITLLLTPFLLHRLGQEQFGLWSLTLAISSYFGIADSITTGAVRYIAHYRAVEDWDGLNHTIGAASRIYVALTCVTLAVCCVTTYFAPHIFKVTPQNLLILRLMILNLGVISAIGFASVLPVQCVIAAQRQDALNIQMLVLMVIISVLSAAGVALGCSVLLLSGLQIVSVSFNGIIGYRLAKRYLPQANFTVRWSAEHGKKLGAYAGMAVFVSLGGRVIYYTDTLVISSVLSVAAVAGYAVVLKVTELMRSLVNTGASVVGTFASEQQALGNHENLAKMWYEGTKWSLTITLPVGMLLILMRQEIISSWVGSQYLWVAPALVWLVIGHIFDLSQSAAFNVLMNTGKLAALAVAISIEAVCNFSLSVWLCHRIGVTGVAIGTTLPLILRCLIFYPVFMTRLTHTSLANYLKKAVLPPCLAFLPTCLILTVARVCGVHGSLPALLLMALLTAAGAIASACAFCLTQAQRAGVSRIGARLGRQVLRRPPVSEEAR